MANESIASVSSLVNASSSGSEISITRVRDVDVNAKDASRVDVVQSLAQARATAAQQSQVSRQAIERVVSELEAYVQNAQRNLDFHVDDKTGRVVVRVVDATNDSVIRQIPSEEMIAISHRLQEFMDENQLDMRGMLLEIKA
jgi:flagellar protein FlaG